MDAIDARLTPVPTEFLAAALPGSPAERPAAASSGPPEVSRAPTRDDSVLSPEGLAALARSLAPEGTTQASEAEETNTVRAGAEARSGSRRGPGATTLTPEEQKVVRELSARDREVRAHEQAHKAAAGDLATSGPTYSYQRGPDGVNYAVGGEVGISLAEGRTPEETVRRAERIQRAALAPAEPSAQDRAVAAQAAQMAIQARAEVQAQKQAERAESSQEGQPSPSTRRAAIDAYRTVAEAFTRPGAESESGPAAAESER